MCMTLDLDHRFQKSSFSPVQNQNEVFTKVFVFISVFDRFSVLDRQKGIKQYVFSNENALLKTGLR